jgi:outer membrane murein-binding lipoprotein Lpp
MAIPLIIPAIAVGGQIINGIVAQNKANQAKTDAKNLADDITRLENNRVPIENPYANATDLSGTLRNPFANLSVATAAAEMQAEEADQALANTLDAMQAGGFGAGGATALAQAAAKSKQGIAADIQQQEANNEKLRAQGEQALQTEIMQEKIRMQNLDAKGKLFMYKEQDKRDMQQLDRAQALYDNQLAQQMQYQQDATAAFTGAASSFTQFAMAPSGTFSDSLFKP